MRGLWGNEERLLPIGQKKAFVGYSRLKICVNTEILRLRYTLDFRRERRDSPPFCAANPSRMAERAWVWMGNC